MANADPWVCGCWSCCPHPHLSILLSSTTKNSLIWYNDMQVWLGVSRRCTWQRLVFPSLKYLSLELTVKFFFWTNIDSEVWCWQWEPIYRNIIIIISPKLYSAYWAYSFIISLYLDLFLAYYIPTYKKENNDLKFPYHYFESEN